MVTATGELILAMVNAKGCRKADIHQSVVATPAIRVKHRIEADAPANHRLERGFFAVRDDFGVHLVVAFQQPEDDGFTRCPATAFAAPAARPEVTLIDFDIAIVEGRLWFADVGKAVTNFEKDRGDRFAG